jgi:hypothetical protein
MSSQFKFILLLLLGLSTIAGKAQSDGKAVLLKPKIALTDSVSQAAISEALNHYPDLAYNRIKVKYKPIKTTLNIRPTILSTLFRSKRNRTYILRVNSRIRDSAFQITNVPYSARVGLFGHEMAHVEDYSQRNVLGIIYRAFQYLTNKGREKYEKDVDQIALRHGLENQLLDWALFIQKSPHIPRDYKKFKRRFYLEAREIRKYSEEEFSE